MAVIDLVVIGESGKGLAVVSARGVLDLAIDETEAELSCKRSQRRQRIFLSFNFVDKLYATERLDCYILM